MVKHTAVDDFYALFSGLLLISLGLYLFKSGGLLFGAVYGLALILTKATVLSFGVLYWIANIPFYLAGYRHFGIKIIIKTFISVTLLASAIEFQEVIWRDVGVDKIHPLYLSIVGSFVESVGVLILIRHGASLGGTNLLAIAIQDRFKVSAGTVGGLIDGLILVAVYFYLESTPELLLYSLIGLIVFNMTLKINHKEGRYVC